MSAFMQRLRRADTDLLQLLKDGLVTVDRVVDLKTIKDLDYIKDVIHEGNKRANEIADAMHVSAKTVSTYTARILQKTGWKNKVEMTKYCVQHGLTEKE